ncbi:cytochrome c peroxidase [Methylomarinovum caldicuralii]|uniref:Cytochrome c peroxidase n=1 Tax=Methylomarinovum caldicuralii TaxID=438856 RepID=A0AAU9BT54_9GAMM|nr:cytochrome c peroxidase [Methylomarinovum caldicuralii]BCX81776.1 cytochrome c peroxidase [Methylomarinovum caldicuralii]
MYRQLLTVIVLLPGSLSATEPILPLPPAPAPTPSARLGERLFHDPRLSGSGRIRCADCHRLEAGGDDDSPLPAIRSGPYPHNTLTVFNAVFNYRLHWYGDLATLKQQAETALQRDMRVDWNRSLARLKADDGYRRDFAALYGDIDAEAVIDALVAFERTLVTPDAPFDRFLRGDESALTPAQKRGYRLFKRYGCSACHQGVNVGGNLLQKLGIFGRYPSADPGRIAVTGREEYRDVFRVPSLRNVALTAPYFHDGGVQTLEKAVTLMAELQLGTRPPPRDVKAIVAFLKSLTGRYLRPKPP